ncbi:MAG: peptidoglycan-binding domain-containing protein [Cyanobacteria bacterium P01_D01_bin.44]
MPNFNNGSSINWDQKGTGWIPDYPDIRDYYLKSEEIQHNSNIIRDEAGGSIEVLASNFAALLDNLKSQKNLEGVSDNISTIEQIITRKILGEVVVSNVRYQRILRRGIPDCQENADLKLNLYRLANPENTAINRIVVGCETYEFENLKTLWRGQDLHQYLKNHRFDASTEAMVKAFQRDFSRLLARAHHVEELIEDGIVGFRTHAAIQACLSYLGKTLQNDQSFSETVRGVQIELISIPSVMPPDVFSAVIDTLDKFKPTAESEALSLAYYEKSKEQPTIKVFLERTINEFLEIIRKGFAQSSQRDIDKDSCYKRTRADEILRKVFPEIIWEIAQSPNQSHRLSDLVDEDTEINVVYLHAFRTIYQTTFVEIEPLTSVILKLISPLANYEDLPSAFEQGIIKLIVIVDLFKDYYSDYFFDKASNIYNIILPQKVEDSLSQYGLTLPEYNKGFSKREQADAWHAIKKVRSKLCDLREKRRNALAKRLEALNQKLNRIHLGTCSF